MINNKYTNVIKLELLTSWRVVNQFLYFTNALVLTIAVFFLILQWKNVKVYVYVKICSLFVNNACGVIVSLVSFVCLLIYNAFACFFKKFYAIFRFSMLNVPWAF